MERHPDLRDRIQARIDAARRGEKVAYRRGKPVVSKGCRNCHKKKR